MPEPLRIVFVLSGYAPGGAETQLAHLIERRPAEARDVSLHTVTLLSPTSAEIAERYASLGVANTLVERTAMSFGSFMWRLVRTIASLRPVIVHTQLDSSPGAWGRLAAWLARVPVIVHSDLSLMVEGTRAHLLLRPHLDRVTARFFPNADAIADRLVRSGIPRERITVIPCGVDLARFDPATVHPARARWGLPPGATVAGFLGRFARVKRIDVLLDALLTLAPSDRPDRVLLGGDGPEMTSVRERVERDPWLRGHVELPGMVHDVPSFLSAIDYLVLPSDMEGLPNVVLEAMAMGKPVVATRVSDVPLIVGGAGFLAEPGDVASMADAIASMQRAPATERERMAATGRRRVEDDFDLDRIARRFWHEHLALARTEGRSVGAAGP